MDYRGVAYISSIERHETVPPIWIWKLHIYYYINISQGLLALI